MGDEKEIPFPWLWISLIIVAVFVSLNFLGVVNNLAYILITAGFLITGFILGVFLQGSGAEKTDFGLKLLFIGILLLLAYFAF
ncbi:MAG: hypothetical protein GXO64_02805 [Candidatus Micrarchaeota archaeon]|nr:hypothetical protein [Candidatus Micrarchaeota archaeon]